MRVSRSRSLSIVIACAVVIALLVSALPGSVPRLAAATTINVPGDYPTIQAAIDAAAAGDTIVVAAGTYVEKVTINKSLTLNGANAGISAGAVPQTRGPESIIQGGVVIQADNVVLDGFKIDGPASTGQKAGIYLAGGTSGFTIANNVLAGHGAASGDGWAMEFGYYTSDVTVRNNGIGNWWSTYVNPTNPSANILFEGNHFHDNSCGIGSDGLNDVNLQYNKFTNNTVEGWGTSNVGSDVRAHNNDFVGNGAGINNYGGGTVDATNNWWGHNTGPYNATSNPGGKGDAVSNGVLWDPPTTRIVSGVWVDDDYNSSTPGWFITHFATIQDGVDKVDLDGTVNVAAGTYNERVVINKSLTLSGAQAGVDARGRVASESIIDGGVTQENYPTIRVTPDVTDITIDGFKIIGSRGAVDCDAAHVWFLNNIVEANSSTSGQNVATLVFLTGIAEQITVRYNDMSPTPVLSPGTNCLRIQTDGAKATVLIDSNIFRNASSAGVGFSGGNADADVTFTNNEIYGNGSDGMFAYNCEFGDFTATGNRFENNGEWGVKFASGVKLVGSITVNDNVIAGNGTGGLQNVNSVFTVDATNNWWGDASGPSGEGPGTGDAVSTYVDYDPWLGGAPGSPTVTAVDPDSGMQGQTLNVAITGTNFTGATAVSFGSGINTNSFNINSATQITASITVAADATPGARDVSVTNYMGTGTLTGGFAVLPPQSGAGWYEQWTVGDVGSAFYGSEWRYQTFTPSSSHYFDLVSLYMYKQGSPNFTATVSLFSVDGEQKPAGSALCSTSFNASTLTTAAAWYVYEYDHASRHWVSGGTEYAIVLSCNGGNSSNLVRLMCDSAGGYDRGLRGYSSNGGLSWVTIPTQDMAFKEGQSPDQAVPVVSWVFPYELVQGEALSAVVIEGNDFFGATSVSFGSGITVDGFTVDSRTQITASITAQVGAELGARDVSVTTAVGTGTLPGGFTVIPPQTGAGWYEQWTVGDVGSTFYGSNWRYQTFTPMSSHAFDLVSLYMYKQGSPGFTVTVSLYNVDGEHRPAGSALRSSSFNASTLTTAAAWYDYPFSSRYGVSAGTEYAIVLSCNGGDSKNLIRLMCDSAGGYAGGVRGYSSNGGLSWVAIPSQDMAFKEGQSPDQAVPVVISVHPYQLVEGEVASAVVIEGNDFLGATSVSFGPGITVDGFTVESRTQVTASITVQVGAAPGARDVSVTTAVGTGTLPGGFTVASGSGPGWYEEWTVGDVGSSFYGSNWRYQTFTPGASHYFDLVSLYMYKQGSPDFTVTVSLYNVDGEHKPVGSALCSTSFNASTLTTAAAWYDYQFGSRYWVSGGTEYAIVLSCNGGDSSNLIRLMTDSNGGYAYGVRGYSTDGGSSWTSIPTQDMAFREGEL